MEVLKTIADVRRVRREVTGSLALVPTMGALHQGHLSLMNLAREKAEKVMFYIFVNPTQFNNPDDLKNYPRDIERDISLLREKGVDYVFTPDVDVIYAGNMGTKVIPCSLGEVMEGPNRPGHFQGVCTVLNIFFNLVRPDFAVFGEKDYQQMRIVEEMVKDLRMDLEIVRAPISREESGLARSSRNELLSMEERGKAKVISEALSLIKDMKAQGELKTEVLLRAGGQVLARVPELKPEYLTINSAVDLKEANGVLDRADYRVFFAGSLGKVRLIDNMGI